MARLEPHEIDYLAGLIGGRTTVQYTTVEEIFVVTQRQLVRELLRLYPNGARDLFRNAMEAKNG